MARGSCLRGIVLLAALLLLVRCGSEDPETDSFAFAATVPSEFVDQTLVSGLASPTAMAFAPDGRLFVCEQGGRLRVVKNGQLLATPFLTVTVNSSGERGLLGVTFDPSFATNRYVYVYYTATTPTLHNRLSRFTANGDVAVAGSETILLELDNLSSATNHNGGAIHFGNDGKLYVAVGDNANGSNAQTLNNLLGKLLRLNADGSIPTDNPFYTTASGKNRAIWALGLRNPFTFDVQRTTGRIFINDVGQNTFEEINDGIAGANYGWPATEGPAGAPYRSPLFWYGHGSGSTTGCAITGGAFYNPVTAQFPSSYQGKYFFADFCSNWIRLFDPATATSTAFATNASAPVDLRVGPDGALYYLARGAGAVGRISYGANAAPAILTHPANRTVAVGAPATFTVEASGSQPLSYQWQRNGSNISGATSASYTLASASASDNGAVYRVVVQNSFGSATSNGATLTVLSNSAPTASITSPASGTTYAAGETFTYSGTGTDPEDGALPPSAFTWRVDFHHDTHFHPFIPSTSGVTSGSFTIPTVGHTETNVWYRVHLTVRDSAGLTHSVFRDIQPRLSTIRLRSSPTGLGLTLDGQPVTTPIDVPGVVGVERMLGVTTPQTVGGTTYTFASWSDGGATTHTISTPPTATTYTATFQPSASDGGLTADYYDNMNFTGARVTRVDPTINFDWGSGAPAPGIGADTFSVRWTGTLVPRFTQTYTFTTTSDDGVRLYIDGIRVIDNWTDHAPTDNTGTFALTAGRKHLIEMEFYENGGGAVAKLFWASTSQPKEIIPASQLMPSLPMSFPIRINFQLAGAPVPSGYVPDTGAVWGYRGSDLVFGWNVSHTDVTRDRNRNANQLLDTLCHFHSGANWQIALPNGAYSVLAVIGDAQFESTHTLIVEGVTYWNAVSLSPNQFLDSTRSVTVADGRLTLTQGSAAEKATRIDYIEVTRL